MCESVIELVQLTKRYGHFTAVDRLDLKIHKGEIFGLLGPNGAGKSTLMKVLAGSNPDYTGDVLYNGNVVELRNPAAAKKLGIQIVYQEVDMALIPTLSVAENVMFNDMVMNMGHKQFVNYGKIRKDAKEALARLNIDIDVKRWCGTLTLAQKQMVLIARAVQNSCNFLILDEPTAPLSDTETEELFRVVKHLRETENIAIIFITHRIQEVLRICDSYTVMRNGQVVDTTPITPQTTSKEIVDKMLGRSFEENFPKEVCEIGEKSFVIDHLTERENRVKDVSMYVRKGEIVGHLVLVPNPSFHDGDMDLKDGLINRADKKYTYGNIAVFSPKIFAGEKPEFSKLFPWLYQFVDQQLVSGEIYKGPWANVGTPEELAKCESMGCFFNETDIS